MKTLNEFYRLIESTVPIRRELVQAYLTGEPRPTLVEALSHARRRLDLPERDDRGRARLLDETGHEAVLFTGYESTEMDRDLTFFEKGEAAYHGALETEYPGYRAAVDQLVAFLDDAAARFDTVVTDRDGTVNNYCGRYRSSVQAAYNAVFLARFAAGISSQPVVLTSAPLMHGGIVDVSVLPEHRFVLAGSKGREYLDPHGERRAQPLPADGEARLSELNRRIQELLAQPRNRIFELIGSSFQRKHGETTVARQDVNLSVSDSESRRFAEEVRAVVDELNSPDRVFSVEDTGRDLEIVLEPAFDKGAGFAFLMDELGRSARGERVLICGDTASDVPMVERAVELGASVAAVFVTDDADLQARVNTSGADAFYVRSPDVLVAGLDRAVTKGEAS
jgi:phosphoglycolate phosphatase-like HAD superfamily hydrolase